MTVEEIRGKFHAGDCEYSLHAVDKSILRRIAVPGDKYGPGCLIFGTTQVGRAPYAVHAFLEADSKNHSALPTRYNDMDRVQKTETKSMTCEVCGVGERRERLIRYTRSIGDSVIVIDHVSVIVCDHCGETSFRPDVVDNLQKTVWQNSAPSRVIETPVYEFAA